ncbi:MAG: hypothetical protein ACLT33_09460 [Lachnospira pectinoschiza]
MSFYKYCGRQLQDREVCTCQQAQQSARHSLSRNLSAGSAADIQQEQVGRHISSTAGFNQQQASRQMDALKKAGANAALDYVNVLKGLFTSPVETVSAFVAKANVDCNVVVIRQLLTCLQDYLIC